METSTAKKIAFWTLLAGLTAGATYYLYNQFKLLGDTCYSFAGVVVRKLSMTKVELTILYKLLNHSDIPLTVNTQKYEIYLNDILVSTINRNVPFKLPANSSKTMTLDVSFIPKDLLKAGWEAIQQLALDQSKMMITIKGTIYVKAGILSFRTLNFDIKMSLKEMIEIYKAPESDTCKDFK